MINIEYVNGSINLETNHLFNEYESFMESCKNDINTMFADFDMMQEKITLESAIMGTVPENVMMVYESEKKNIFTKIGKMVVAIYNKFVELIDKIVDQIKTMSFKKKSDLQKLDILLKKHPELKNEAIAAFNEGALDLSDVRSLKELDATFDEILKMARKKDIDPKSLRGKWEKAKEKFEKDEKSWKVVKVAAATTTVVTAVLALKTLSGKWTQATNDANEAKKKLREDKAVILEALEKEGVIDSNTGKWQTMLQIWREYNGKHSAVRNENLSVLNKLANGITSFLDKHPIDKEAGNRLRSDLAHAAANVKGRKISERNAKIDEAYSTAFARAEAGADYKKENP